VTTPVKPHITTNDEHTKLPESVLATSDEGQREHLCPHTSKNYSKTKGFLTGASLENMKQRRVI